MYIGTANYFSGLNSRPNSLKFSTTMKTRKNPSIPDIEQNTMVLEYTARNERLMINCFVFE